MCVTNNVHHRNNPHHENLQSCLFFRRSFCFRYNNGKSRISRTAVHKVKKIISQLINHFHMLPNTAILLSAKKNFWENVRQNASFLFEINISFSAVNCYAKLYGFFGPATPTWITLTQFFSRLVLVQMQINSVLNLCRMVPYQTFAWKFKHVLLFHKQT